MAESHLAPVLRHIRKLVGAPDDALVTDQDLLQRIAGRRDRDAFEELVRRHGPMVWRVCRRLLPQVERAEDAFQATFLVLAQRAAAIRKPEALISWLHGVAFRVASRARASHEPPNASPMLEQVSPAPDPSREAVWRELGHILEGEIAGLPEKLRLPLLLCFWKGLTNDEAARRLGWPTGTVKTRLAKARALLHDRLTRRGVTLPAGAIALLLSPSGLAEAHVPAALGVATVHAAAAALTGSLAVQVGVRTGAAVLAQGALAGAAWVKLKIIAVVLLAMSAAVLGVGTLSWTSPNQKSASESKPSGDERLAVKELGKANTDLHGDPLPPGALARLGTLRWRTPKQVDAIAFAPDGKTLAVASYGLLSLRLFDTTSGKATKNLSLPRISHDYYVNYIPCLAFSSDGKRLAGMAENGHVQVRHLGGTSKLEEFKVSKVEAATIKWLGWSADDHLLAVFAAKEAILVRMLETGREQSFQVKELGEPDSAHIACSYAAAAKMLAVSDWHGIIHVWDTTTGKERCALKPKNDSVRALVLSSNGRTLASLVVDAKAEGTVELWDIASARATHTLATGEDHPTGIGLAPDGKTLATVSWRHIRFWNVVDGRECGRTKGVDNFSPRIAFSADGKTLATTENYSGGVHLWDVATGSLKPEPTGQTNKPRSLAFSPDGQRLASGGMDGTILVWDLNTSKSLARIHKGGLVRDCAFSADGKSILSCWSSNHLHFSDAATGHDLHSVRLEDPNRADQIQDGLTMRLSGDGKTLSVLSTSNNQRYLVTGWDALTRKQIFARTLQPSNSGGIFSPDAKLWAVFQNGPGQDLKKALIGSGAIVLEDVATGEPLLTFPSVAGQTRLVAFSPDARLLATSTFVSSLGDNEGKQILRLWEVVTASEILALSTVSNTRVAFTPDNRLLAIAAPAQTILLWDLRRGQELHRLKGFDVDVSSLAFAPDGRRLASGLSDTTILVWDVGPAPHAAAALDADGTAQAWADLAADARKAFAARNALAGSPALALPLLKDRLRPAPPVDAQRLGRLISDLGSEHFTVRQKAQKALEEMGELAKGAYQRTLSEKPSLEVRQRIEGLLQRLRGPVTRPDKLQALRAVAVLEDIATPEARQLLETLARGEPEARVTQEAQTSLSRLGRRHDKKGP